MDDDNNIGGDNNEAADELISEEMQGRMLRAYRLDETVPRNITENENAILQNPFWIKNMGSSKWLKTPQNRLIGAENPQFESRILGMRKPGELSGLINHGTTCYANSTLQSWFHNPIFRRAILSIEIDPEDDTKTIVMALQKLFAQLKFSEFKGIDPAPLYTTLKMNNVDQHDAQEFAMKLINLLSENEPTLKQIFERNLFGTQKYETKCPGCDSTSTNTEEYSIIQLSLEHSLEQAVGCKLEAETMEYRCNSCGGMEATRTLQFVTFPPVLQFQVNRYKFNPKTRTTTKVTTPFIYPDEMNFQPYLVESNDENYEYSAFAALIHYGSSANSGHFVMKVRNHTTGIWHNFSDESLDETEAVDDGMNESDNVYMVLYVRKTVLASFPTDDITTVNSEIETNLKAMIKEEDKERATLKKKMHIQFMARCDIAKSMITSPRVGSALDYHFLSNAWLREFFRSLDSLKVSNQGLICPHGKVAPPSTSTPSRPSNPQYRVLPPEIAIRIYNEMGGGPQLVVKNMLCMKCVISSTIGKHDRSPASASVSVSQEEVLVGDVPMEVNNDDVVLENADNEIAENADFFIHYYQSVATDVGKSSKQGCTLSVKGSTTLGELISLISLSLDKNGAEIIVVFNGKKLLDLEKSLSSYGMSSACCAVEVILK